MNNIKDYRNSELKSYVIGNALIILFLSGVLDGLFRMELDDMIDIISVIIQSTLLSSVLYIYVFLLDSLIPGNIKFIVAYLFKGHMPAYTIFSDMKRKLKEDRFTVQDVMIKYKEVYDNMPIDKKEKQRYENAQWYRIYSVHQNKDKVYTANRDYLLCRDIVIATLFIIVIYIACVFLLGAFSLSFKTVGFLIGETILADIAMRGKGSRLAYNVIAEDIYSKER